MNKSSWCHKRLTNLIFLPTALSREYHTFPAFLPVLRENTYIAFLFFSQVIGQNNDFCDWFLRPIYSHLIGHFFISNSES